MNPTMKAIAITLATDTAIWSIAKSTYRKVKPVAGNTVAIVAGTASACTAIIVTAMVMAAAMKLTDRKTTQ